MDGDDRVPAVVRATEHLLDLGRLDFLVERVERLCEFRVDAFARPGPLDEDPEIVAFAPKGLNQIAILFQPFAALEDLLGLGLVVPETGRGGARLEAGQLVLWAGGFKDSSADRPRGA
jgi:hypothetical protein